MLCTIVIISWLLFYLKSRGTFPSSLVVSLSFRLLRVSFCYWSSWRWGALSVLTHSTRGTLCEPGLFWVALLLNLLAILDPLPVFDILRCIVVFLTQNISAPSRGVMGYTLFFTRHWPKIQLLYMEAPCADEAHNHSCPSRLSLLLIVHSIDSSLSYYLLVGRSYTRMKSWRDGTFGTSLILLFYRSSFSVLCQKATLYLCGME